MSRGDDHPSSLFCGDEGPTDPSDEIPKETDQFEAGTWASTITYKEIHSFALGFLPVCLLLLLTPFFAQAAPPLLLVVVTVTLGGIWTNKVPRGHPRRWLCKEPHYAWGGQLVAVLLAGPIFLLAGGV